MSGRQQRVMVQPINVIFKYLQTGTRIQIWLYDNLDMRLEGKLIGFDEFMNVVLDEAQEVVIKSKRGKEVGARTDLGRLLLKGENITLMQAA
ncbi:small nuclear ribonucleoprotein E [Atractiella rhizophila]|nr:small nuclear ribonucleoprotein E [Atractiella rhizophila]